MNTKRKSLTAEHQALYALIPEGREKALRINVLAAVMDVHERRVRQMIEDLTVNGCVICNLQNGSGYYKPNTDEDFEAMLKLNASRAHALLRKDYAIRKALERFRYGGNSLFAEH